MRICFFNKSMLEMRVRWIWVIVVSAIAVAVLLIVYRDHYVLVGSDVYRIDALTGHFCKYPCQTFPPQVYPSPGPSRTPFNINAYMATQPMKEQLAYTRAQRLRKLQAWKPMSMSNFGQQTNASHFRLNVLFRDVLEASDGTLWVIYETCAFMGPGGCSRFHLAILDGEQLTDVWLPHNHGEWNAMDFTGSSTPDAPVVRVSQWESTGIHQYRVTKHDITQESADGNSGFSSTAMGYDKRLRDGSRCGIERSRSSSAFVNAVDSHGRTRALVSKNDFLAAVENIVQLTDLEFAYCTHFEDIDMLIVGDAGSQVTFVLGPDRLWLASPGAPFAITQHHLVQFTDVLDENGAPTGSWDYVNVTGKQPRV